MARTVILGATGLTGGLVTRQLIDQGRSGDLCLLLRRPPELSDLQDAHVEISETEHWPMLLEASGADIVISCLGSTIKKAGSQAAFQAIDRDLVAAAAAAAKKGGVRQFIAISSTMANSSSSQFYLRTKGEAEDAMRAQQFDRLDIIRPGLLVGKRTDDARLGESLAIMASPIIDRLLYGSLRRYRSIPAATVAAAIVRLAGMRESGTKIHENDDIRELAKNI